MNVPLPDVPEVRVVGLPQLTTGFDLVERLDLAMHLKVHGPLEPMTGERLAELAEAISLRGRGGAGFPFGKKLRAVAKASIRRGVRPVVVINGSEGEPACRKDTVLLNRAPHLILDGALLAAEALGARTLVVAVTRNSTEISVRNALAERGLSDRRGQHLRARVVRTPERMVSGEASAVIRAVNGGPALPPGRRERAAESGVGGAPTLLSNAETYAQLAVAARIGSRRYGHTGLPDEPGTVLLTVSGAVARPMVVEVPTGFPSGTSCSWPVPRRCPRAYSPAATTATGSMRSPRTTPWSPGPPWLQPGVRSVRAPSCRSGRRPARSGSR